LEFKYPIIILIAILVIAGLTIFFHILKKSGKYSGGPRSANSILMMKSPEFRAARRKHLILSVIMKISLITAALSVSFLAARPYIKENVSVGVKKRDIMLCMDTSFYLDTLNSDLIDAVEGIVKGLDGDRFGISLYSSSSLLYVPLTDDYDYVIDKLEELKEYFNLGIKLDQYYGDYIIEHGSLSAEMQAEYDKDMDRMNELSWIGIATSQHEYSKGPFLVGDGLASCLYSFPMLDLEDRSRIIILSTENAEPVDANPVVDLQEASGLCAQHDVTVFGLFRGESAFESSTGANDFFLHDVETDTDYEEAGKELKECVEKTGGKFYEYGKGMTPEGMVKDIASQEAMQVKTLTINKETDKPELFIYILGVSVLIMLAANLFEVKSNGKYI
jgi:hypothetical protein